MNENMPKLPRPALWDDNRVVPLSGKYSDEQMYQYARDYVKESNLVLRITTAYEQGVGHARRTELSNPYGEGTPDYEAWDMGREFGLRNHLTTAF